MDTGSKTLAQLSEENKAIKYVTLDVGSTISGYTKDYLDRLCRLNKVEYRLWNKGQFVIELESLLAATHTILLSYEGISFVDHMEIIDSLPHVVGNILTAQPPPDHSSALLPPGGAAESSLPTFRGITQPMPRFGGDDGRAVGEKPASSISVVGRSVTSDFVTTKDENTRKEEVATPLVPRSDDARSNRDVLSVGVASEGEKNVSIASIEMAAIRVDVTNHAHEVSGLNQLPKVLAKDTPSGMSAVATIPTESKMRDEVLEVKLDKAEVAISPRVESPSLIAGARESEVIGKNEKEVLVEKSHHAITSGAVVILPPGGHGHSNDWDALLLDANAATKAPVHPPHVSLHIANGDKVDLQRSQYHPIQTSVDATPHHDNVPLFPQTRNTPEAKSVILPAVEIKETVSITEPDKKEIPTVTPVSPLMAAHAPIVNLPIPPLDEKTVVQDVSKQNSTTEGERRMIVHPPYLPAEIAKDSSSSIFVPEKRMAPAIPESSVHAMTTTKEHHLVAAEKHALTKSVGFNSVFVLAVLGSAFLLFGGTYFDGRAGKLGEYIAGVGAVEFRRESLPSYSVSATTTLTVLPFSDEIVATPGDSPNSVVIQPVFKNSAGEAREYGLVELPPAPKP